MGIRCCDAAFTCSGAADLSDIGLNSLKKINSINKDSPAGTKSWRITLESLLPACCPTCPTPSFNISKWPWIHSAAGKSSMCSLICGGFYVWSETTAFKTKDKNGFWRCWSQVGALALAAALPGGFVVVMQGEGYGLKWIDWHIKDKRQVEGLGHATFQASTGQSVTSVWVSWPVATFCLRHDEIFLIYLVCSRTYLPFFVELTAAKASIYNS